MGCRPARGRQAIVRPGRELVLGRQPVVHRHHHARCTGGQSHADVVMRIQVQHHKAAAMKKHQHRVRPLALRRVYPRRNVPARPWNQHILHGSQSDIRLARRARLGLNPRQCHPQFTVGAHRRCAQGRFDHGMQRHEWGSWWVGAVLIQVLSPAQRGHSTHSRSGWFTLLASAPASGPVPAK